MQAKAMGARQWALEGTNYLLINLLLKNLQRSSSHLSMGKILLGNNSPIELKQF